MLAHRIVLKRGPSIWHRRLLSIFRRPTMRECVTNVKQQDSGEGGVNAFVAFNQAPTGVESAPGRLANCAIAVKDNICTSEFPTTSSSLILQDFQPSYDATVVRLLKEEGATIIGKTNCDEFGMGSMNTYTYHGPVLNPFQTPSPMIPWRHREQRSAGGSSGGSAAAVAAYMCYAALSTDTGGSTRLPASYCGIVGFKPSYGLISRWGVISFADSLDCVGIMAAGVSQVHSLFRVLEKYDINDPTSIPNELRDEARSAIQSNLPNDLKNIVIGIPEEYFPAELNPSISDLFLSTISKLRNLGAIIVPISLPNTKYALSAYYVLASSEAGSNLARYDGIRYGFRSGTRSPVTTSANVYASTRTKGFGEEVQRRILLGTYALTSEAFDNYFLQAQRVRLLVRSDFDRVFRIPNVLSSTPNNPSAARRVDVIMHPSAIRTAPLVQRQKENSELDPYVQDVLTVPASLAGVPALSVPMGMSRDDGWPVGLSIVGQWGTDELVMAIGQLTERALGGFLK
ncbi:amidase signature domain-containing protein [Cantharellus anzutake]|uniref:amidase signature domain-containing protein n=1 Tax=Cantharellus anzutake TaxID=1750568 RepID=UPI0019053D38|nr:amidase signature domain-containing protein [Cantharellus anzutake]KAF8324327.1 amidase signature domain-containing protein [Cantharellus anzutake]